MNKTLEYLTTDLIVGQWEDKQDTKEGNITKGVTLTKPVTEGVIAKTDGYYNSNSAERDGLIVSNGISYFPTLTSNATLISIIKENYPALLEQHQFPITNLNFSLDNTPQITYITVADYKKWLSEGKAITSYVSSNYFYVVVDMIVPASTNNPSARAKLVSALFQYYRLTLPKSTAVTQGALLPHDSYIATTSTRPIEDYRNTADVLPKGYDIDLLKVLLEINSEEKALECIASLFEDANSVQILGKKFILVSKKMDKPTYKGFVLVAHLDTVPITKVKLESRISDPNILTNKYYSPIGFDDKAGVVNAILLHKIHNIPILFTTGEESGGKGATAFCGQFSKKIKDTKIPEFPIPNTKLLIELDRNGIDWVSYTDMPATYAKVLKSLPIKEGIGTYSDVATLSDHFCIPSINVGTGYYSEHTSAENLNVNQWRNQRNNIVPMIMAAFDKVSCAMITSNSSYRDFSNYNNYDFWNQRQRSNRHRENNRYSNTCSSTKFLPGITSKYNSKSYVADSCTEDAVYERIEELLSVITEEICKVAQDQKISAIKLADAFAAAFDLDSSGYIAGIAVHLLKKVKSEEIDDHIYSEFASE
jgi:hypothetical protein